MGETRVKVGVVNLTDAHLKAVEVECLVDTGATLTVIPRDILTQAKITPVGKIELHLADGRGISRDYGNAYLFLDGETIPARVVFGEKNDPALLGLTALETANLTVDPVARKLVKQRYYHHY